MTTTNLENASAEQLKPLVELAMQMRDEQRRYFGATDSRAKTVALQRARVLERDFDRMAKPYMPTTE